MSPDPDTLELTVVMPVYNEEDGLAECVLSWSRTLDGTGIDYELLIIDDGSTDSTSQVLAELGSLPRVSCTSKPNEGHGPTILRGYREAALRSEWVFQTDSDDEIPADAFPALWEARHDHDAVLGIRTGRSQSIGRKAISVAAKVTARVAYGSRVADVNVPYRLIRSEVLAPIAARIPDDTFAPNVIISGALARVGAAVAEVPVPHQERKAGQVSIIGWSALKAASRSFVQSLRIARTFRTG